MSYILEALRKAEQQREIGRVPGIGSGHETIPVVTGGRWLWVLIVVLVVNAGLLIYAFWPAAGPEPGAVVESDPVPKREPPAAPTAVPAPLVPAPVPAETLAMPPAVQPMQTDAQRVEMEPVPLRPLKPLPEVAPKKVLEQQPVQTGIPVDSASGQRQVRQKPAVDRNNNLPVWPQVSAQLFQQMRGGLRLDVHVYSEQPRERFVLINMQKYNQGQQLQEGPVVDEITTEGVILSFQGQRFRLRSQ